MPKSRVERALIWLLRNLRIVIMAWMIGIANAFQQKAEFMDEPAFRIEQIEEMENGEPFEELESDD